MNKIFIGLLSAAIVMMLSVVSIGSNEAEASSRHAQKKSHNSKKGKHRKARHKKKRTGGGCQTLSSSTLHRKASQYNKSISSASKKYGVSQSLIKAVITIESCFKRRARGSLGEKGLMQLMPNTAKRLKVRDGYSAWQNVHGGAKYLAWLLKRYNGNMQRAIAAYNAGEGNIDKGRIPNRGYVNKVLHAYRKFSSSKKGVKHLTSSRAVKKSAAISASMYKVKSGDTVYEVMRQTGTRVDSIIKLNNLQRPYRLKAGQQLRVSKSKKAAKNHEVSKPVANKSSDGNTKHYTVQAGDTVYNVMRQTGISVKKIIRLNRLSVPYDITTGQSLRLK